MLLGMPAVRLNDGPPVPAHLGQDVLAALLDGGQPALYLCMSGSCGRCRCRVEAGAEALAPLSPAERQHGCGAAVRLACQARIMAEGIIAVRQPA